MKSFLGLRETYWTGVNGPRLHIVLPAPPSVRALAQAYLPVLTRYDHALRIVPADRLHVPLGWLPTAADEITEAQREQFRDALRAACEKAP